MITKTAWHALAPDDIYLGQTANDAGALGAAPAWWFQSSCFYG